jgi:hypothetical protein
MELYLSPTGKDTGSGTAAEPLATLARARDLVRDAIARGIDEDITVWLAGGVYPITETVLFGPQDSAPAGRTVTYAAMADQWPVLSGGVPVEGWRRPDKALEGLPADSAAHIWVADCPAGIGRIGALFDRAGLLQRAASPRRVTAEESEEHESRTELVFEAGDIRAWPNLEDVELFMTPRVPWTVNYLPLASVDEEARVAKTGLSATYPLTTRTGPAHIAKFYRIENFLDYLAGPGQWVQDTRAGRIYLWPRTEGPPEDIVAPALTELVRFEGDLDAAGWVRGIVFDGLTFSHGDRMRFREGRLSLQHDWEQLDEPNALLRLRGAEGVAIRNCRFAHSGGTAVRLDLHAVDNAVVHNEIFDVGGTGVVLAGYGAGSRDENHHNVVQANHIHHVGQLWWHSAGVFVSQSGHNHIADNLIHHTPYCAMVLSGPRMSVLDPQGNRVHEGALTVRPEEMGDTPHEWPFMLGFRHARFNVVEHNEVHNAMQLLGDGNGIYVSGTGVGNVIRRNFVHDVEGAGTVSAIRLDDEEFYTLVEDNVVWRICGAGIMSKNLNTVENNIVVDCYGPRQYGYLAARHRGPCHGTGMRRNLLIRTPREQKEPFFRFDDPIGFLHQVTLDDNLLWDVDEPEAAEAALEDLRGREKGRRSVVADPLFLDLEGGDFRLRPDSPALRTGYRPISLWGPREEPGPAPSLRG